MYLIMLSYTSKADEEDAIIALHEHWERYHRSQIPGCIRGELLRNAANPRQFLAFLYFESRETAKAYQIEHEQDGWYQRLISLTEHVPTFTNYRSEWQSL